MKKTLAIILVAVICMVGMAGCSSGEPAEAAPAKAYLNVINTQNMEGNGVEIPMFTDTLFVDNGDGTYTLYENLTVDITQASAGYLNQVGGGKVAFGKCTRTTQDGETAYTLEKPTRIIMSSYMMTGPANTTEIYVDSADSETYANYSPADITSLSEAEVVDILLKTSVTGGVSEGDAQYKTTVVVDEEQFMLTDIY